MRKLIYAVAFFSLIAIGCTKNDEVKCPYTETNVTKNEAEATRVKEYLASKEITDYVEDPTGLFYKIETAGTGTVTPVVCSQVSVKYKGQLTDGTVFDQTTGSNVANFYLGQVILGWQKGIPKIKSGGKITLYIPPYMGYGANDVKDNTGKVVIPGNSILVFDVELIDAQ